MRSSKNTREVVDETINAYVVQKLDDGSVRLRSGGFVTIKDSYFECLQSYAQHQQEHVADLPEHLRRDRYGSIYDGYVPLLSFDSSGFTPEQMLDEITSHPLEIVLGDLDFVVDENDCCDDTNESSESTESGGRSTAGREAYPDEDDGGPGIEW